MKLVSEQTTKVIHSDLAAVKIFPLRAGQFMDAHRSACSLTHYTLEGIFDKTIELGLGVDRRTHNHFFRNPQTVEIANRQRRHLRTKIGECVALMSAEVFQCSELP